MSTTSSKLCLITLALLLSVSVGCDNNEDNNANNIDDPTDVTPDLIADVMPDVDSTVDEKEDQDEDMTSTNCAANERVVSAACEACPAGTTNPAGDDPAGADTQCTATLCAENERVEANECLPCAAGSTNPAGDDATGEATACEATLCAENERVQDNACVACDPSASNEVGDDATGANTVCDDECSVVLGVSCADFEQAYIKSSNTEADDTFGHAVALDGDTMVVGAFEEDSASSADQANNAAVQSGAAYVFTRTNGVWSQQAYLKSAVPEGGAPVGDSFGFSVAIDGDTIVVGAIGEDSNATGVNGDETNNTLEASGAAYVFTRANNAWTQQAYLKASNTELFDFFGYAVDVKGDTIVVGANNEASNAAGVNGDQTNNDTPGSGAVYVFARQGTDWTQQAYLKASNPGTSDGFGQAVTMSGDTLVVGAANEASNATSVNGDETNNAAPRSGAAYVFTRAGTDWSQQAYLKTSNSQTNDGFGFAMDVDGDTLVVGALNEQSNATGVNGDEANNAIDKSGAAYVFARVGTDWTQQAYLKASNPDANDNFGQSVSIDGDTIVVGAHKEGSSATGVDGDGAANDAPLSGAAYMFARVGTDWTLQAYIKASNVGVDDTFGFSVALSGNTLALGASKESSNATGVNGDQTDDSAVGAGAVYVRQIAP